MSNVRIRQFCFSPTERLTRQVMVNRNYVCHLPFLKYATILKPFCESNDSASEERVISCPKRRYSQISP